MDDDELSLKLKFLDETKRQSTLPDSYEALTVRVKEIIYNKTRQEPLPRFELKYEDDLNGMIGIESDSEYQNAISHTTMLGLNRLLVHVVLEDEATVRASVMDAGAEEAKQPAPPVSEQPAESQIDLL